MEVLFLLIPVSLILIIIIAAVFFWAVKSGQYDDLEAPRHRILMDDDDIIEGSDTDSSDIDARQGVNDDANKASIVKPDRN